MAYYWCLQHERVEPEGGQCDATRRMGPYETAEDAANWKERVEARNDAWDEE